MNLTTPSVSTKMLFVKMLLIYSKIHIYRYKSLLSYSCWSSFIVLCVVTYTVQISWVLPVVGSVAITKRHSLLMAPTMGAVISGSSGYSGCKCSKFEQPPAAEEAYTYEKVPVTVLCTILKGILKRNKKTVPYRCGIGTGQKIWIICIIL